MKYSDLHEGKTIIHVVGGKMNIDLAEHIGQIAQWFVDNDITLLWGDDYQAEFDKHHPVKVLADQIALRGGNSPIRILQLGKDYLQLDSQSTEEVFDDNGRCIGKIDKGVQDQTVIYTDKQQNRQMLYYNNADALMVLNGGIGAAYEIPNSIIYAFSGDVPEHFKTIIVDDPETHKFKWSSRAYLATGELIMDEISQISYFESAKAFVESIQSEITTKNNKEVE